MQIITAISNNKIAEKLRKENNSIILENMKYYEEIFEALEKNKRINTIILSDDLTEEKNFNKIIKKLIKTKINIIVILQQKRKNYNYLSKKRNIIVLYNSKFIVKEIIKILNNKKEKLKKGKSKANIITIFGTPGIGKSIFTILFSKNIKEKKILIITFSDDINIITGLKNNCQINKNINLIKIEEKNYSLKVLENNIEKYELIIVELINNNKIIKDFATNSNKNIFLLEPNLLEIKKAKDILEKYLYEIGIERKNIKIIFNKDKTKSINREILKTIFSEFEILGFLKFREEYDKLINKNLKAIINKNIKKELIYLKEKLEV